MKINVLMFVICILLLVYLQLKLQHEYIMTQQYQITLHPSAVKGLIIYRGVIVLWVEERGLESEGTLKR